MSRSSTLRPLLAATALCSPLLSLPAHAQDAGDDEIIVSAGREIVLDSRSETGSRLELSVRETPASLEVLTQERFLERGQRTSNEALNSAAGVTALDTGGSPGTVSMRGFGGNSVSHNYDGIHQPSTMVSRNFDSFAFERIEVLKGPASVLYGEGALGGAINFVPKKPILGRDGFSGLAQFGSNETYRVAADVNAAMGEKAAMRGLLSYAASDGYIGEIKSESLSANLGLTLQPADNLSIFLGAEYFWKDDGPIYWGTPLVADTVARDPSDLVRTPNGRVLDLALRETNFQYEDAKVRSDSTWLRSQVKWEINPVWTLRNDLSYNNGDRLWYDAESYRFVDATAMVSRTAIYIRNMLDFWHERLTLSSDGALFGQRNRFLIGAEYSENDHMHHRRTGGAVPVDPYDFVPGYFPHSFPGGMIESAANIKVAAVFGENAYNVTDDLLFVVGGRYEEMKLERAVDDLVTGTLSVYDRKYNPFSYRGGLVYSLTDRTQIYTQYTRAAAPVSTLVLLSFGNADYDLTNGESAEVGVKSSFLNDRVTATLSGYWIRQKDILTRDPSDPNAQPFQGGAQSTRGVELGFSAALTRELRLDGNVALLDAKYDELVEAGGADRTGNTPSNVAEDMVNLFAVYQFADLPIKLTGGMRRVGDTYGDSANMIKIEGYTLFDASIGYTFDFGELTFRARNLTDRTYVEWGGSSTVYLGAPRTFDVTFQAKF